MNIKRCFDKKATKNWIGVHFEWYQIEVLSSFGSSIKSRESASFQPFFQEAILAGSIRSIEFIKLAVSDC
jgi:hypothetical protein